MCTRGSFYSLISWRNPATSCLIAICSGLWFYIQKKNIGYFQIGLNYETAILGHHSRIITSAFSHISILHLVFNMSALWSLGVVEQLGHFGLGVQYYLQCTLGFVIWSGMLVLGMYHVLIQQFKIEYFQRVAAVGYSCCLWVDDDSLCQAVIIKAGTFWFTFTAKQFCSL